MAMAVFDSSGHDINLDRITASALRREGFAFGRYVALLLQHQIKAARDAGNLTDEAHDEVNQTVLAYWNDTISLLKPHLSPGQIEIFEDAANAAREAKSKEIVRELRRAEIVICN